MPAIDLWHAAGTALILESQMWPRARDAYVSSGRSRSLVDSLAESTILLPCEEPTQ